MTRRETSPRAWCIAALVLIATSLTSAQTKQHAPAARTPDGRQPVVRTLPRQPLAFERADPGRDRAGDRTRYVARGSGYLVALDDGEATLALRRGADGPAARTPAGRASAEDFDVLRMQLVGATPASAMAGLDRLPGKVYYADRTTPGPLTGSETFRRVQYTGVYRGIDVIYYGNDRQLEFDFVVSPQADPRQIKLTFAGADRVTIAANGELILRTAGTNSQEVRLKTPTIYQERDGVRQSVTGGYVLSGKGRRTVGFRLGAYDRSLPLVIDPTWMFGSTSEDWLVGIETDSTGQPHVLSLTFDPGTFPFTVTEPGVVGTPNCALSKLDTATGLYTYVIVFRNEQRCDTIAVSPNDVAYFTGFSLAYPRATTVTSVTDVSATPTVSYFGVSNYDSSALGSGVAGLAVNSLEHVFLIGPCRVVTAGDPPLELNGFNDTPDPPTATTDAACSGPGSPALTDVLQPVVTVTDNAGELLYGSLLSPGEHNPFERNYALTADDTDRAFIVGAQSHTLATTPDAVNGTCPAGDCSYLLVVDTAKGGPASLAYASYLWQARDARTVAVRRGPAGEVFVASQATVFDDFPSNRPTNPYPWEFARFPAAKQGLQLARFDLDEHDLPRLFNFAALFSPAGVSIAPPGSRDELTDLRVLPSGAPVVGSLAYVATTPSTTRLFGWMIVFYRSGEMVAAHPNYPLTSDTGAQQFRFATDAAGTLVAAFHVAGPSGTDSNIEVDTTALADPGPNTPPAFSANDVVVVAPDRVGAFVPGFSYFYYDAEDGTTAASFSCTRRPGEYFPVGITPVVCTYADQGGLGGSTTFQVRVDPAPIVGEPFVGLTSTPRDSATNAQVFEYRPATITATSAQPDAITYLTTRFGMVPPVPPALQAGSPPMYFELTAERALGPFGVCLDTSGMSFPRPSTIRLYHHDGTAWVDVTRTGSPSGAQVCGDAATLGTFAIFYPPVPSTAIQTIAGNGIREFSGDGPGGNLADDFVAGPALATPLNYLYSGALDRTRNLLYFSDASLFINKLNLTTGAISRVAGNGVLLGNIDGPGGDPHDDFVEGGHPFNTYVGVPFEMVVDPAGDLLFFDRNTCRIRKLDFAANRLFSVAGNGTCGFDGDGFPAANASLSFGALVFDAGGNLFMADANHGRIRRVDAASGIITTVAGDGAAGIPEDGPSSATISAPLAMAFDRQGYLLVVGGLHLLRIAPGADGLINGSADETFHIVAGCNTDCQKPFGGDGLPASNKTLLSNVGWMTVAADGGVLIGDVLRIRRIEPGADGVVTGAGDEIVHTIGGYLDFAHDVVDNYNGDTFATQALLAPVLFFAEDNQGRIVVVDTNNFRVRRFGLADTGSGPANATVMVLETIQVTDGPAVRPAARIDITEQIVVTDAPTVRPSVWLVVPESIIVTDTPTVRPAARVNVAETIVVTDAPVVTLPDLVAPVLTLPGTQTVIATSAGGAAVTYTATAIDAVSGPVTPSCTPASGTTFPVGTTMVTCTAVDAAGNRATGAFAVVVSVGTPSISATVVTSGKDTTSRVYLELLVRNSGTGHARNVTITTVTPRLLAGTGSVSNAGIPPLILPMVLGNLDAGATQTIRLYFTVPFGSGIRFSVTETGTLQNVLGTSYSFSLGQSVTPPALPFPF